jgi:hypothetical protein
MLLSQEVALNFIRLTDRPYRPPEILRLQRQIDARTLVAEQKCLVTNEVDYEEILAIAAMKHELDRLYVRWARGEIQ